MSDQPEPRPPAPSPDRVLHLAFFLVALCFAYLFMELWYPVKQGSAVFGLLMLIAGFYFGATYAKNIQPGG